MGLEPDDEMISTMGSSMGSALSRVEVSDASVREKKEESMKLATSCGIDLVRAPVDRASGRLFMNCRALFAGVVILVTTMLLVASTVAAVADITTGLVAYYPLNGNAVDATGSGRDGTVHGATATADKCGSPNGAFAFNGGGDYIVASATGLPTAERTVSLWFQMNTIGSHPVPVVLGYGGGTCGTSWFEQVSPSGFGVTSHCGVNSFSCSYAVQAGTWYHWVITTSASGTKMYLDGNPLCSGALFISNTSVTGKELAIGVDVSPSGFAPYTDANVTYTNGKIDEVRIYNRALTDDDVWELFESSPTASNPSSWGRMKALYH
jgi:hypothetical protein